VIDTFPLQSRYQCQQHLILSCCRETLDIRSSKQLNTNCLVSTCLTNRKSSQLVLIQLIQCYMSCHSSLCFHLLSPPSQLDAMTAMPSSSIKQSDHSPLPVSPSAKNSKFDVSSSDPNTHHNSESVSSSVSSHSHSHTPSAPLTDNLVEVRNNKFTQSCNVGVSFLHVPLTGTEVFRAQPS